MIHNTDCMDPFFGVPSLPDNSVDCCVTSPPYWGLRDYGCPGQLGLEDSPEEFTEKLVRVFGEVKKVLKPEGTLWLNLGDSYSTGCNNPQGVVGSREARDKPRTGAKHRRVPVGLKPKDLVGIPWRVAFALQADGWFLRSEIIWHKPNPMPESIKDRPTKAHEQIFLLAKSKKYFYDAESVKEAAVGGAAGDKQRTDANVRSPHFKSGTVASGVPWSGSATRSRRSVWTVASKPFRGAHFATFPPALIEPCIKAGCPDGGIVLDPFFGAGTTGLVARAIGRRYIGFELNPEYVALAKHRLETED